MRPMFLDFPQQEGLFNIETQFMFGDNILVTPKLEEPEVAAEGGETNVNVTAYLPDAANWFNYNTKLAATSSTMEM